MNHTRSVFTYAYVSCALARRLQLPLTTVAEDTQNAFEKVNLFTLTIPLACITRLLFSLLVVVITVAIIILHLAWIGFHKFPPLFKNMCKFE